MKFELAIWAIIFTMTVVNWFIATDLSNAITFTIGVPAAAYIFYHQRKRHENEDRT